MGPEMGDRLCQKCHLRSASHSIANYEQSATYTLISGAFLGGSTNIGEFIFFRFMAGAGYVY